MTTELTTYQQPAHEGMSLQTLGTMLAKSGYFQDTRDAAQAIVKVLAGQELGIGPIASMTGIYIVKGRVTMGGNLIAAQIKRSKRYDYRVLQLDDKGCEIAFYEFRASQLTELGRSTFNEADAKAAGLTASENYKKFPRNMYFNRAISNGAKWYTPEVFGGSAIYTPEELAMADAETSYQQPVRTDVDVATGEIVDVKPAQPAPVQTARQSLIAELKRLHTEAASMELDSGLTGRMPSQMSDKEIAQAIAGIAAMLAAAKEIEAEETADVSL